MNTASNIGLHILRKDIREFQKESPRVNDSVYNILNSIQTCPNCENDFLESSWCMECWYLSLSNLDGNEKWYKVISDNISSTNTTSNSKNVKYTDGIFAIYKIDLNEINRVKSVYIILNWTKYRINIDYKISDIDSEYVNFSEQELDFRNVNTVFYILSWLKIINCQKKVKVWYSELNNVNYYQINVDMLMSFLKKFLNKYHFNY